VLAVVAWRREVIIEIARASIRKTVELVLGPFPYVAEHVIETSARRWEHINGLNASRNETIDYHKSHFYWQQRYEKIRLAPAH